MISYIVRATLVNFEDIYKELDTVSSRNRKTKYEQEGTEIGG